MSRAFLVTGITRGHMALITFRDSQGVQWRVWNVSRDTLGPTRADYLGQEYRLGWLVFQREESDERRRLSQFPDDWAAMTPQQLERMCAAARPVTAARRSGSGSVMEMSDEGPRYER
jgi:hypothetical protein